MAFNLKGHLLPSERWHFARQEVSFHEPKGHLLKWHPVYDRERQEARPNDKNLPIQTYRMTDM